MAPHPGGVHAALDAARDADVVFVAHTGLDGPRDAPRHLARAAHGQGHHDARLARAPLRTCPKTSTRSAAWLFDWFARIDAWIDAHSEVSA